MNKVPWGGYSSPLIFFLIFAVFLRWSTFYQSAIDSDESLYILVANAWSAGNPPYTIIWDNKPIGIYLIFMTAMSVMGQSIFSIRLISCLFIGITCFLLFKIGKLFSQNGREIGMLSGILYATNSLSSGGMASNTEIFFIPFSVGALYLIAKCNLPPFEQGSKKYGTIFLAGLLFGIGFEIKYVVLFDFLAILLILTASFLAHKRKASNYLALLRTLSILTLGFILPFATVSLYFVFKGLFADYVYANFVANKLRTIDVKFSIQASLNAVLKQVKSNSIVWGCLPLTLLYLINVKSIPLRERWILKSLICLFFTGLFCICTIFRGVFYGHYFLQLFPWLCLVSSYFFFTLATMLSELKISKYKRNITLGIFLLFLLNPKGLFRALNSSAQYVYYRHIEGIKLWGDSPAAIADYLKSRISAQQYIYVVEDLPIIYFLTNARIPSRYAFPPFLVKCCSVPNITGINRLKELERILEKKPSYIIVSKLPKTAEYYSKNKNFFKKINRAIINDYHLETSIDEYNLFKKNTELAQLL